MGERLVAMAVSPVRAEGVRQTPEMIITPGASGWKSAYDTALGARTSTPAVSPFPLA